MKLKLLALYLSISLSSHFASNLRADYITKDAGTGSGDFFSIIASPVAAALAGCGGAHINDVNAMDLNPAGIARIRGREFYFSHVLWFDEMNFSEVKFGGAATKKISAGICVKRIAFSDFILDDRGYGKDTLYYQDLQISAGAGYRLDKLTSAGVCIKYLSEKIYTVSGSGFAIDAGIIRKRSDKITYGASILNFLGRMNYPSYSEEMRWNLKLSGTMKLDSLKVMADVNNYISAAGFNFEPAVGAEFKTLYPVYLRAGARGNASDLTNAKFALGVGFDAGKFAIDYAAELLPLGITHRAGLGMKF